MKASVQILLALITLLGEGAFAADTFTVKAPDGRMVRVKEVTREQSREAIRDLPVSHFNFKGCKSAEENLVGLELELELNTVIETLSKQSKPRKLSEQQEDLLSTTPFCPTYYSHFVVISYLLTGYDLIAIRELASLNSH